MQQKSEEQRPQRLPSRWWYLLSLAVFLTGLTLGLYYMYQAITQPTHIIKMTPQSSVINVTSPGKYTLWLIRSKEDTTQENSEGLLSAPDVLGQSTISFKEASSGNIIPIQLSKGWHFKTKDVVQFSLGDAYFEKPGTYSLSITNPPQETYTLYLHKPHMAQIIKDILLSVFLIVMSLVAGIILLLTVFLKRINVREANSPQLASPKQESSMDTGWAMLCHLIGFVGLIFPFGNILAPLIVWVYKKHESSFVDFHGREAVNFQISVSIYYVICIILSLVIVGLILLPLLAAFQAIAMIVAAIAAANGNLFRYPLSMRFLK